MVKLLMIQPENQEINRFRRLQFNNFSQITIPYLAAFVDERYYKPIIDKIHRHGIMIQVGIVFGFDSDTKDVFDSTLAACERLGIDGATVSILTPFPKTPVYEQFKDEQRLLTDDWRCYNSKTAVVFKPKNMSAEELFAGYNRFQQQFYSPGSFIRRMRVSRTNIAVNFIINLGYWRRFHPFIRHPFNTILDFTPQLDQFLNIFIHLLFQINPLTDIFFRSIFRRPAFNFLSSRDRTDAKRQAF